jgi:hypothetical protein
LSEVLVGVGEVVAMKMICSAGFPKLKWVRDLDYD